MNELIERLEQATGPDRDLDGDIAVSMGLYARRPVVCVPPAYTSSLDAALTLVPEDTDEREYSATVYTGHHPQARIFYRTPDKEAEGGYVLGAPCNWPDSGANPAIAVCIASLRSRVQ